MTTVHWLNPISALFSDGADWSTGTVPGPRDDVVLDAPGDTPYTVTVDTDQTVSSIQTAPSATLALVDDNTSVRFTASSGTGVGANAGTIAIGSFTTLSVGANLDNSGVISVAGASGDELLFQTDTTLTGYGQISMIGAGANRVVGGSQPVTLTNVNNKISGMGSLGGATLTITNETLGVIDGSGARALSVLGQTTIDNDGLIEGTGSGGITLNNTRLFNGSLGELFSGSASTVRLEDSVVTGGLLKSVGTGFIDVHGSVSDIDGTSSAVTIIGDVQVTDGGYLDMFGVIANLGTIGITLGHLLVTDTTFVGGGEIDLGSNTNNEIGGASATATLVNVDNTIDGEGLFGHSPGPNYQPLTLTNQRYGIIDADGAAALTIDTKLNTIVNAGLIEATGAGGCVIASAVSNTGAFQANGGTLTLEAPVTGSGQISVVAGTVVIENADAAEPIVFTGATGVLVLTQSQTFAGRIKGFAKKGRTTLDLRDIDFVSPTEATFSGTSTSGVLTVTDGVHTAAITLVGDYIASTFVASSDGAGGVAVVLHPFNVVSGPHALISAMAGLGASAASHAQSGEAWSDRQPSLMLPRMVFA